MPEEKFSKKRHADRQARRRLTPARSSAPCGLRNVLYRESRHVWIAASLHSVGRNSYRKNGIIAGVLLVACFVLFIVRSVTGADDRSEMPWLLLGSLGCFVSSLIIFVGVLLKIASDLPIVFDQNEGVFYGGRYQPDSSRIPETARPLSSIKCVQFREEIDISIVLSEPEGKTISILDPMASHVVEMAQELGEFLNVPVVEADVAPEDDS